MSKLIDELLEMNPVHRGLIPLKPGEFILIGNPIGRTWWRDHEGNEVSQPPTGAVAYRALHELPLGMREETDAEFRTKLKGKYAQ